MDHFEPIGGEAGVGVTVTVVDDLACFIRQVEEARTTWGKEIAESFDVAMPPPSEMSMHGCIFEEKKSSLSNSLNRCGF